MTQKKKPSKAKVYVWPLLTEHDRDEVEGQCLAAGYENKRKVRTGRIICWEIS